MCPLCSRDHQPMSEMKCKQVRRQRTVRSLAPKYRWERTGTQVMAGLGGYWRGRDTGRAQSPGLSDMGGVSEGDRGAMDASRFPAERPGSPRAAVRRRGSWTVLMTKSCEAPGGQESHWSGAARAWRGFREQHSQDTIRKAKGKPFICKPQCLILTCKSP